MGEEIRYEFGIAQSISIDLNLKQITEQCNQKINSIKTRLGKVEFPIQAEDETQLHKGEEVEVTFTKVPFEAGPLIYTHLHATKNKDAAVARKEYLRTLRSIDEKYFSICRDANQDFQKLYTDSLCMEELVERISMILTLSQMGTPQVRPQILLDCLSNLEGLIWHLQNTYFPTGYAEPYEAILDIKTGVPFTSLYNRLTSHRPAFDPKDKKKYLVLEPADCSEEERKLATKLVAKLGDVNSRRATITGIEKREKAERLYMKWLETHLSAEEKKTAREFSERTSRLEAYLRTPNSYTDQRVRGELFKISYHFAHQLLKDNIITMEENQQAFTLEPLPPEALFLEQAAAAASLRIMKTVVPYISLSNALQSISHMVLYIEKIKELDPSTAKLATATLMLGNKKILDTVVSLLPQMLLATGLRNESGSILDYVKEHPMEAAADIRSLFSSLSDDCQRCDIGLECRACSLRPDCPYYQYAQKGEIDFQHLTLALTTSPDADTADILKGINAIVLLYSIGTSILVRRVAESETEQLYRTWKKHRDDNERLQPILDKNEFTKHILKVVQKF